MFDLLTFNNCFLVGLTYNDVMNWSKSRFYFTNVCKISQFFNRKLDEKKSRDMMTMLKEFLDYKPKLVDSTNVVLPEEVERFIDESKTIMMSRGLLSLVCLFCNQHTYRNLQNRINGPGFCGVDQKTFPCRTKVL